MMHHHGWRALFVAALLVSGPWACSDEEGGADAGAADSGVQFDGGPRADAAASDSGALDAGSADADAPGLARVAVVPRDVSLRPGETEQLSVTGAFSDGSNREITTGVTWRSSAPELATVSEGGLVTAVAAGRAEITATVRGF